MISMLVLQNNVSSSLSKRIVLDRDLHRVVGVVGAVVTRRAITHNSSQKQVALGQCILHQLLSLQSLVLHSRTTLPCLLEFCRVALGRITLYIFQICSGLH